jgi:hypothetical protein
VSHQQSPVQLASLERIRKRLLQKHRTVPDTVRTVPVPWVGSTRLSTLDRSRPCDALGLRRVTWLTLRRTYSSWAHEKGVPGKVVAQLLGHTKVINIGRISLALCVAACRRLPPFVASKGQETGNVGHGARSTDRLVPASRASRIDPMAVLRKS